jgi:hypothetical protein
MLENISDWPVMIKNPLLKWDEVKMRIENAVLKYVRKS